MIVNIVYIDVLWFIFRYCNFRIGILYGKRWWWLCRKLIKICFGWCWWLLRYYCGRFCIWFWNRGWWLCVIYGRVRIYNKGCWRRFWMCCIIRRRKWRWRWRRLCWRKRRMRWWCWYWWWRWGKGCGRCRCVMCVWFRRWFREIYIRGRWFVMCYRGWLRKVR